MSEGQQGEGSGGREGGRQREGEEEQQQRQREEAKGKAAGGGKTREQGQRQRREGVFQQTDSAAPGQAATAHAGARRPGRVARPARPGGILRHPGLKLNIPPRLFCMGWSPDFEFRGTPCCCRPAAQPVPALIEHSTAGLEGVSRFPGVRLVWCPRSEQRSQPHCTNTATPPGGDVAQLQELLEELPVLLPHLGALLQSMDMIADYLPVRHPLSRVVALLPQPFQQQDADPPGSSPNAYLPSTAWRALRVGRVCVCKGGRTVGVSAVWCRGGECGAVWYVLHEALGQNSPRAANKCSRLESELESEWS